MAHAISKTRLHFRRGLYVLLALSFLFAGTASAFMILIKTKTIQIQDISSTLFQIDIYSHQLQATFQNDAGKFENAATLLRKTFFSKQYVMPAKGMMRDLAYADYPAAQYVHANLIMMDTPDEREKGEAIMFYQDAADKGYAPAKDTLHKISKEY